MTHSGQTQALLLQSTAVGVLRVMRCFLRILLLNGPPLKLRPPGHEHLNIIEALGEVEEQPPVQGGRRHRAGAQRSPPVVEKRRGPETPV